MLSPGAMSDGGGSFLRRLGWRDWTIAGLGLAVVLLGVLLVRDHAGALGLSGGRDESAAQAVAVFDVVLDRQNLSYIDLLFDRPLGEGRVGEALASPPATLSPAVGGVWRWRDPAALRFTPTDRLTMATEYTVALIPERLLGEGQVLTGESELTVRTDRFVVEGVQVREEPAPDAGKGAVVLRGEVRFNYPVDPEELAGKLTLRDPAGPGTGEVEVLLETSYPSAVAAFRSAPVVKRPAARELRLTVAPELTPARGNVALPGEFVQAVPLGSSERLAVRGVSAEPGEKESSFRIAFSSPVTPAAAESHLSLSPEAQVRLSSEGNALVVTGELRAGSSYTVEIRQGLAASDGAVLAEAYRARVDLPNLAPSAEFESDGMFLSAAGMRSLAVETVNVERVKVTVDRVFRNNLFALFAYQRYLLGPTTYRGSTVQRQLGDRIAEETVEIGGEPNTRKVTPLALDRFVSGQEPGFYRVVLERPGDWQARQRWVLISDLGVVAKRGEGEVAGWVSSFADLTAVAGARVRLVSDQNQVLGEGTTGASGFWRFADLDPEGGRPELVTVEKGDDWSFLHLPSSAVDLTGLDVSGAAPASRGYEAFLYGERDLYRPGETARGLAVVRDRSRRPPPPMPALLRHRDPEGREVAEQRLAIDERGLAELEVELPRYTRTGNHVLELLIADEVVGSYRFQVEEFVPDRIKVEITPQGEPPGPGGELRFAVEADYLFGPPAGGLAVEGRAWLEAAPFAPEGFAGYRFDNPERRFERLAILDREGELDDAGRTELAATVPGSLQPPSSLVALVSARVQERGGRGVTAVERIPVHPYPYYVGLRRTGEGYAEPEQPVELEWVAVAPDGSATRAGGLTAELYWDRWNTVLRRTPEGGFRYESVRDPELVEVRSLPAGESRGAFSVTPGRYGSYRVVLTDPATGASAQVDFYASGWGFAPWAVKSPGRVELDLDRPEYKPGETATVQVRSPFPGKLFLTVERQGMLSSEVHQLTGNTATFELPLREAWRPNVYVTAVVVRAAADVAPGSPGRAFGAVPLTLDRSAKRLAPEIEAPGEIRPRSELAVRVHTAPGAAVTLAAVDEGILRLIDQATPDPFSHFYRKLALGVATYDSFALLLPEVGGEPSAGGGEARSELAQFLSTEAMRRAEPMALWSGVLTAGADGVAAVRFPVPEFQGALRLMAVAVDVDRFGSADGAVRVRDRVVLLPTLPRFLQPGEELEVPLAVRNDTGRDGSFRVEVRTEGPVTPAPEGSPLTVEVPEGGEAVVYLPVRVGKETGTARFTFTAAGNGESTRAGAELSVRPILPAASRVQAGRLDARETAFEVPEDSPFRPETLRRELSLGNVPLVRFAGRLRDLLRYPYGCLEQVTSRILPLVYLGDLARQLDPELFAEADPEVLVEEGIRQLTSLQLGGGGFAMWPGSTTSQPWASIYATHALVEARRAGHLVPGQVLRPAVSYLAASLSAKSSYTQEELERSAYALYVLARAGEADLGTMDFLRERHAGALSPGSGALLAAAYAAVGDPRAAEELAARVGEVEEVERRTGGNLDSTLRNRALLLAALLDAVPDDPRIPELARRLGREAEATTRWTTQESAWTFLALGQLFRRQAELGPAAGTVRLGGRVLGGFGPGPATFHSIAGDEPLAVEVDPESDPQAVFYSLELRGIPTEEAFRPQSRGLEVERTFLTREGKSAALSALTQGDLVVLRTRVRSVSGPVENVVVSALLPPGLEVENPRLRSAETLPWVADANLDPARLDLRDDRVLIFTDLPANQWQTLYTLLRAVVPGTFRLPPLAAEAMYDPALSATGPVGEVRIRRR